MIIKKLKVHTSRLTTVICIAVVGALTTGCGNAPGRETPDDAGDDVINGDGAGDETVSFARDVLPVLVSRCSVCHIEGGIADLQGVPVWLDADRAYDQIVGQPSVLGDFTLVVPGDAENSLVYRKIADSFPPAGARMPLGGPFLDNNTIATIEAWINQGALDN